MAKIYDVIVIGGGATGTGIARDCAMRGLHTVLVEKRDLAGGTTGTCMGMIHGGMRYLEYDIETTKISCIDSGYIQKIAPHLLFRIPFLMPVTKDATYNIELVETFFSAYDKFVKYKRGKKHTRLSKEEALKLEPGLSSDIVGAVTTDEWGIDPFRLCVLNAKSSYQYGAEILTHTEVIKILLDSQKNIIGVRVKDRLNGEEREILSKIVVNAAGPWVPKICEMAGVEVRLRPTKGTNILFDRRLSNVAIVAEAIDGRQILLMPHQNTTLLGCTDDDYYGDLDWIVGNRDEIEYLLQGIERVFPKIRSARIIRVMAGVRPTLFKWRKIEDKLSRDFQIYDHKERDGIEGFITIAGGKLAMYRLMAEKVTDVVCKKLQIDQKCTTHLVPLPGNEKEIDLTLLSREYSLPLYLIKRLFYRYGTEAVKILEQIRENPASKNLICVCEPVTEAEIRYVIREEWAKTVDDIRRRTRLGMGPCQGANCTQKAAIILQEELKQDIDFVHRHTLEFLKLRWKGKYPVLRGEQISQEELNQAIYFNIGNYENLTQYE